MRRSIQTLFYFISLLALLSLTQLSALAQSSDSAIAPMQQANQLYESGNFNEAAQLYQQLVEQDFVDSALYYNLGNAYFKAGDVGRAILNYRKAQRLTPRDADLLNNLAFAQRQIIDEYDDNNTPFFESLIRIAQRWITVDELAILVMALWLLLLLLAVALRLIRHSGKGQQAVQIALFITLLSLIIPATTLGSWAYAESQRDEGVVIASEVDITSGPGSQYVTEFTLHSGAEIYLLEERGSWVRITLPGDLLQGWVPVEAVAPI